MIKRREFIAGLGSAAAWPVVARAQQPPVPMVGFPHRRASNVGRILRTAKPSEVVRAATNLLGLTLPKTCSPPPTR